VHSYTVQCMEACCCLAWHAQGPRQPRQGDVASRKQHPSLPFVLTNNSTSLCFCQQGQDIWRNFAITL
jgi:hypothetical protein